MRPWMLTAGLALLAWASAAAAAPEPARCDLRASAPPDPSPFLLPAPRAEPGPVRARFMGVSTILFDDGRTAILIDGFFSRPNVRGLIPMVQADQGRIGDALERAGFSSGGTRNLAAILVAQSHHDHAMDSAEVARLTGATLFGSASTGQIGCGAGLPAERNQVFRDRHRFALGAFTVTVIKSPHSRPTPTTGDIRRPLRPPRSIFAYREGGNFSFLIEHGRRRILVHPSANFDKGEMALFPADTVFLGIGSLGHPLARSRADYWRELVTATDARLVVPIHWDNFRRSLDEPLEPMPGTCGTLSTLRDLADNARTPVVLRLLPAFGTIELPDPPAGVPAPPPGVAAFDPCPDPRSR